MILTKTHLKDCFIISVKEYTDERGRFFEFYSEKEFKKKGLITSWKQTNVICAKQNTLRGMHMQYHKPMTKYARVLQGKIYDVVVDLRPQSPSYREYGAFLLSSHNTDPVKVPVKDSLYIPAGFAHGFYAYEDSIVLYKCSELFDSESNGGFDPFDSSLGISWPCENPIISSKDANLPSLDQYTSDLSWRTYNPSLIQVVD